MRQPHSPRQSAHSKYLAALSAILLSGVVLGVGALSAACQGSAPAESKEPAANKPAAASAAPAAQAAQPLKAAAEPGSAAAAPAEPPASAAVQLAGKPPAANEAAGAPPSPAADTPKKGNATAKAGDKAPAAAASEKQGSVVSEDAFSVWQQTASPAKAGGPVQLEAVLVAKPPYHCNP
jgi:hypothetical protein